MGECTAIEVVAAVSRGLVLVIAALAGTLSIYLGWKLYKESVLPKTSGEAALSGMKFKLVAAGPGVFFAAFGMWLLVSLVNRPLQIEGPANIKSGAPERRLVIPVSDKATKVAAPDCLVLRRRLQFFDGGREVQPAAVKEAIEIAIAAIRETSKNYTDEKSQSAADAVRMLRALGGAMER